MEYADSVYINIQTVLLLISVFLVCLWYFRQQKSLPPGPWGFPIVGVIPMLAARKGDVYKKFYEWGKKYGGIYTIKLGSHTAVVLCSADIIREAFLKKADFFSTRPTSLYMIKKLRNNKGIVMNNGQDLKDLRKLTLTVLKDFGVGKSKLEERIHDEISSVCSEISKTNGKPFYCKRLFGQAISNVISSIVFGSRFEYDDKEFQDLLDMLDANFASPRFQGISNFVPIFQHFNFSNPRLKKAMDLQGNVRKFIHKRISEHRASFDGQDIRDFIDLYLKYEKEDKNGPYSEENMFFVIQDLFSAGSETTSTTLQWSILYMVLFPDIQKRCRNEILNIIGLDRLPTMSDKAKLTYTEATILEVQRIGNTTPSFVPHNVTEDVSIRGYHLPKDTIVMGSLYSVHMDPKEWEEPEKFNPDRWIENGKIVKSDAFMPFSVGRRACLGESLAKMEFFLFFTSLIQRFEFNVSNEAPSTDGHHGITLVPKPFYIIAQQL